MNIYAATLTVSTPHVEKVDDKVKIYVEPKVDASAPTFGPLSIGPIFIEADRWVDARSFARMRIGVNVDVSTALPEGNEYLPRWQIRFVGSAGGANPVTMQARMLDGSKQETRWTNVRELP